MKKENQEATCGLEDTIFKISGSNMVADNKKGIMA